MPDSGRGPLRAGRVSLDEKPGPQIDIYSPQAASWSSHSVNVFELLGSIPNLGVCKVELLDATYRYNLPEFDQTMTPVGESAIEIIGRCRPPSEMESKGRLPKKQ